MNKKTIDSQVEALRFFPLKIGNRFFLGLKYRRSIVIGLDGSSFFLKTEKNLGTFKFSETFASFRENLITFENLS